MRRKQEKVHQGMIMCKCNYVYWSFVPAENELKAYAKGSLKMWVFEEWFEGGRREMAPHSDTCTLEASLASVGVELENYYQAIK